ncbi:uncharacterized protein LOC8285553 isoform X2 [Ricinus communis]|uniref:uncharacterized protein LOC8285553 isoform X2 n=1 Tax=Ricinus communis TaxID=3988 RepID=UPI00201AA7DD|nr:uncharacterized protein LOC8285553 isoform X2 [Ricinus communis]
MVMDEGFFGEFTFAPSNQTVHANPSLTNGRDSSSANADDDDWGDFIINSGGLPHTLSLPRISSSTNHHHQKKDPSEPNSAPGRVNSGLVEWEKPKGALPLSIFGLEEEEVEEEESGSSATLFSDSNVKKGSGSNVNANVSGSIANVYNNTNNKEGDLSIPDLSNGVRTNSQVTDSNGKNEVKLNFDWDPLNFNSNGLNSITKEGDLIANGAKLGLFDSNDDDDGWEFKDAEPKAPVVEDIAEYAKSVVYINATYLRVSKKNQIENENGPPSKSNGFNTNWNTPNLDFSGWSYNVNGVVSRTNSLLKGPVDANRESPDDDDDDDNGWEFKAADSKHQVGDGKVGQVNTEHLPVLNFDGSTSSWDVFFSGSSAVNSDEKHFNGNLINEKKDSGSADEWAFKGVEPELQVRDGNSEINSENWSTNWTNPSWNASSLGGNVHPNLNALNLDMKQVNLNLFDENVDLGGNDGWEFRIADTVLRTGDGNIKDDGRMPENFGGAINTFGFGSSVQVSGGLYSAPEVDANIGSDEDSWAFKDAFSEITSKDKEEPRVPEDSSAVKVSVYDSEVQGNKVRAGNHKGALPLSIFGDEEKETDDSVIYQDISTQMPTSNSRDSIKSPRVDMSIDDLISSLYIQTEQNDSVNCAQNLSETGLDSTKTASISDLTNANYDLDDDSWEFQDAVTGAEAEDQTSVLGIGESQTKYSAKGKLNDCVQFFSTLKEELQRATLCLFENLKKARSAAAVAGEDANIQALDKEIQDIDNDLHQQSIFSSKVHSDNYSPGDVCLNVFIDVVQEPKFQGFESEYELTKKLSLAENDLRSAVELLKFVNLTLQILTLVSEEVQMNYVSTWFKMLSVCAQELRHGAFIWKKSLEENVHDQLLSKSQGKKYFLALGEIYRVVEVLGSSIKLYKPWILASSTDPMNMFTLLSECSSLWSISGLEEALQSILNLVDFEDFGNLKTLLESIKFIHDLDAHTLYNHVFSGHGPACQLSALTAGTVPGMKTVVWNGDHCFLTLANLWGNLVSSDSPNLPCIHDG